MALAPRHKPMMPATRFATPLALSVVEGSFVFVDQ
jgi:hypothetical protein